MEKRLTTAARETRTRKSQLGSAPPTHPGSSHRVRDGSRSSALQEVALRHLRRTEALVLRNRNRVYVPEWLLKEWGMQVEMNFSEAA